jgi:hypothetical protein
MVIRYFESYLMEASVFSHFYLLLLRIGIVVEVYSFFPSIGENFFPLYNDNCAKSKLIFTLSAYILCFCAYDRAIDFENTCHYMLQQEIALANK